MKTPICISPLLLLLILLPARTQAGRVGKEKAGPVPKISRPAAPLNVFADIEDGWRRGRADKILRHFGRGKVAISVAGIGPTGGFFSKNQSYYLFKDLFKYTITKRFEFVRYRNIGNKGKKVYGVAQRAYKRRNDGRLFKDKIYVSLRREGERWVVSEIKSIR